VLRSEEVSMITGCGLLGDHVSFFKNREKLGMFDISSPAFVDCGATCAPRQVTCVRYFTYILEHLIGNNILNAASMKFEKWELV